MANSINVNLLSKEILKKMGDYIEDIEEQVVEISSNVATEAKKELKEISPRRKGIREKPYYKGWKIRKSKLCGTTYKVEIYNSTNAQLTHLLEFGHATLNGGRTKAIPHIRPIEEKYSKIFEERLEKAIRKVSK